MISMYLADLVFRAKKSHLVTLPPFWGEWKGVWGNLFVSDNQKGAVLASWSKQEVCVHMHNTASQLRKI